jgi:hypothetical protein
MADADCDEAEAVRLLAESVIDGSLRPHAFHKGRTAYPVYKPR